MYEKTCDVYKCDEMSAYLFTFAFASKCITKSKEKKNGDEKTRKYFVPSLIILKSPLS